MWKYSLTLQILLSILLINQLEAKTIWDKLFKFPKYKSIDSKHTYSRWGPYQHPFLELQPVYINVALKVTSFEHNQWTISLLSTWSKCGTFNAPNMIIYAHDHREQISNDHWIRRAIKARLSKTLKEYYNQQWDCWGRCFTHFFGWISCRNRCSYGTYYKSHGVTMVEVDYSQMSTLSYPQAVGTARHVASIVRDYLSVLTHCLKEDKKRFWFYKRVKLSNIHGFATGIGAHILAMTSFSIRHIWRFHQITAVNAATLLYQHAYLSERLDKSDARIVVEIKSCNSIMEYLGLLTPENAVKFSKGKLFINRGYNQPNCPRQELALVNGFQCDCELATELYVNSLEDKCNAEFLTSKSFKTFMDGDVGSCYGSYCYLIKDIIFAGYHFSLSTRYTLTVPNPPFCGKLYVFEIIFESSLSINGVLDVIIVEDKMSSSPIRINLGTLVGKIIVRKMVAIQNLGDEPKGLVIQGFGIFGVLKKVSLQDHHRYNHRKTMFQSCLDSFWFGMKQKINFGGCATR